MKWRIYTDNEIKKLLENEFIREVKYKRELDYDPVFKLWSIMMKFDFPELTAREIFERAGIEVKILHNRLPQRRIKEWVDSYKKFGSLYFIPKEVPYTSVSDLRRKELLETTLKRLSEIEDEK